MKVYFFTVLAILFVGEHFIFANSEVNAKAINIDAHYKENSNQATDEELKSLRTELGNVRNLKKGYQKKEKMYGKLVKESEGLKENFESYLEQRDEWNQAIDGYNKLMECTKNNPTKDCMKNSKRRKKQAPLEMSTPTKKSDTEQANYDNHALTQPVQKWNKEKTEPNLEVNVIMPKHDHENDYSKQRSRMNDYIARVDQKVSSRTYELNYCYRKSRTKQEGVLPLVLKIGQNGQLDHLSYADTTQVYNKKLINCLTRVLYNITYPQSPTGKIVAIKKVFTFELHNI